MIKTAVILAAGLGSRLGERTRDKPKGFVVIDHKPIVEHSICKLLAVDIERIVIGTGYRSEAYEQLAKKYPQVTCVRNTEYETTGSMYTLYHLKDELSNDFLLLESDLLYEKRALSALLQHQMPDVMLASACTDSKDEVFIESDANHYLVNLSKHKERLQNVCAELVGITKVRYQTLQMMCAHAEQVFQQTKQLDYEIVLAAIAKTACIYVHQLKDLAWCEIDNETQLTTAVRDIYPIVQARDLISWPVKRNILLNPGPATSTDSVKFAQVVPDICPRETEFGEVLTFISAELTKFVADPQTYQTVLFGGSGTAAVEAIMSSVIGQDAVLIISNGRYGERMCEIAEAYGLNYIVYQSSPYEALDLNAIEETIVNSMVKISHLAVVHNETTTGLLNDVEWLGKICKKYQIDMIVDAMSSFGAIPIDMEEMNISYLASSSNKNLQGMAGVGFVIANTARLESTRNIPPRNFYLHLYSQYKFFMESNQMRFTPPVQTLYALKQAIIETKVEGIEQRYQRYSDMWKTLITGITELGLQYLVKEESHSRIITTIVEPACDNYDFNNMHDYLYRNGFTVYPGKLEALNTFRVANIGDLRCEDIRAFLSSLGRYLQDIGYVTSA